MLPSTGHENNTAQPKADQRLSSSLIFQFHCVCVCVCVALLIDKGDYTENSQVEFCPSQQCAFKPFTCLDAEKDRLKQKQNKNCITCNAWVVAIVLQPRRGPAPHNTKVSEARWVS